MDNNNKDILSFAVNGKNKLGGIYIRPAGVERVDIDNVFVDNLTDTFVTQIRSSVLNQNNHGEYMELGISPAVFNNDFLQKARLFCNKSIMHYNDKEGFCITVAYYFKRTVGMFQEGWLTAKIGDSRYYKDVGNPANKDAVVGTNSNLRRKNDTMILQLLRFPQKSYYRNPRFFKQLLLDHIRPMFVEIFYGAYIHNFDASIQLFDFPMWPSSIPNCNHINDENSPPCGRSAQNLAVRSSNRSGLELTEALQRYKSGKIGKKKKVAPVVEQRSSENDGVTKSLLPTAAAVVAGNNQKVYHPWRGNFKILLLSMICVIWSLDKFWFHWYFH